MAGTQFVALLPRIARSELDNNFFGLECLICRTTYDKDTKHAVRLPCRGEHTFHRDCVLEWLSEDQDNKDSCPYCFEELFKTLTEMSGSDFVAGVETVVPGGIPRGFYESECVFCRSSFEADTDDAVQTVCSHLFHRPCLDQWLSDEGEGQEYYPTCRQRLYKKLKYRRRRHHQRTFRVDIQAPDVVAARVRFGPPQGLIIDPRFLDKRFHNPPNKHVSASIGGIIAVHHTNTQNLLQEPSELRFTFNNHRIPRRFGTTTQAEAREEQRRNAPLKANDFDILGWVLKVTTEYGLWPDVDLYDEICDERPLYKHRDGRLPRRRDPQASCLTEQEELALFNVLRRRPQTFSLKVDAGIRDVYIIYNGDTDTIPWRLQNITGTWTQNDNQWMLEGFLRGWQDFDTVLANFMRRGIDTWSEEMIERDAKTLGDKLVDWAGAGGYDRGRKYRKR